MKIIIALLILTHTAHAATCQPPVLKFGTKVKIVRSTYSSYSPEAYVKNLKGVVVGKFSSSYDKNCRTEIIEVSVCAPPPNGNHCNKFNLCETDVEVID